MAIDYVVMEAAGSYNGAGAGAAVAYGERGGVGSRTGVGVYRVTLDKGHDISEGIVMASVKGATPATIAVATVSDTVKQIATQTVGGAAGPVDVDFDWCSIRFAP